MGHIYIYIYIYISDVQRIIHTVRSRFVVLFCILQGRFNIDNYWWIYHMYPTRDDSLTKTKPNTDWVHNSCDILNIERLRDCLIQLHRIDTKMCVLAIYWIYKQIIMTPSYQNHIYPTTQLLSDQSCCVPSWRHFSQERHMFKSTINVFVALQ